MAGHERGRSPSAGLKHSPAASPHPPLDSFTGADGSFNLHNGLSAQTAAGAYLDPGLAQDYTQQGQWSLGTTYNGYSEQHQNYQPPILPSQNDTSAFPSFDFNPNTSDQTSFLDPALLNDFDLSSIQLPPSQQGGQQPNATLNPMATMQSHSPTPPHLLPEMARRHSQSPSPHTSPSVQQANFGSFTRPRNTSESLDPSSAMFPQGQQNEWSGMRAYRGHNRTPSDQFSDISSHSNQASPYIPNLDSFDANAHSSPLLNASQDPIFNNDLGLQEFSLNEGQLHQQSQQQHFHSPGHSPQPSPRLMPQQQLPQYTAADNYGMNAGIHTHFSQQTNGLDMFPPTSQEAFPALNNQSPNDFGQADTMSPPEIAIDFAPPAKIESVRPGPADDTLSPPARSKFATSKQIRRFLNTDKATTAPSRNRMRAKSDPYAGSRPASPGVTGRGRSPSLQPQTSIATDSLSPLDAPPSRSPSPARGRNGSLGSRARSVSNASDQRDYILDLANPERTPSNGADSKRIQKHPATFQCHLCPKRFTRAYNLRSHLRTHTDERPFVCTVCGKAFARQHDRKRHEGLHSGEKKFVCKGNLQSGSQWGCGRRFARADALGRHFRSEAGRVCIKPLLDEEAAERQKAWMEEQQQAQIAAGLVAPQPMLNQPHMDMPGGFLPAALLQQYPALAGIDWNSIPQGPPPEEEYSGRSSYDASSGGEYYDDMSENEMGSYQDPSMMEQINNMNQMGMNQGMGMGMAQAQPGAQGYGVYGNQAGDYLSDFEGR